MNYNKKTVKDIDVSGKKVLLRCDFNVPQDKTTGAITDDKRIRAALPTIQYLLDQGAAVIACSHLGKPKGEVKPELSLKPVSVRLSELLGKPVIMAGDVVGPDAKAKAAALKPGEIMLLENTRFEPGETKNDPELAKEMASMAEIYVSDAFGAVHRAHASTAGVAAYLPAVSGFLIQKELEVMGGALANPKRPLVAILGGSKVSSKIGVINNLLNIADTIIIGGGMSYTFAKAQGAKVGKSLLEEDWIQYAGEMVEKAKEKGVKLLLPVDGLAATEFSADAEAHLVDGVDIPDGMMGMDIGPKTIELYTDAVKNAGIDKNDVEYVIDCAEEACGDMNQRGGGNFAKAAAEVAGLVNATGSDVRGFCAAPVHAVIEAASLVKSGAYRTVVVTSGGCTAKLGMNGKDHVKKGLPILEDCLGGFAVVISENDGVNPEIDLGMLGRHTVGTGSAPQAVIGSLVADPLDRAGMKIPDIDKYSPEMQNPDITKPAGAGDVPEANYKMIAALGVKRGEIARTDIAKFVKEHGMTGWAPTQGHIPSGVPYMGPLREEVLAGETKRAMIIGKGSLFLGRMTNLFDGVSFVVQANDGSSKNDMAGIDEAAVKTMIGQAMREFAKGLLGEE